MKEYKNILIVRTDRIGDVILTTPAIEALRRGYPKARISILVSPQTIELVDGNPNIDEIIVDDRKGAHGGFFGFWKLALLLKSKKFDCAIVFHTKKRTNILCFHAGIPDRIGYRNEKFGFFLTQPVLDTRNQGSKHEAEYCLDIISAMGLDRGGKVFLPLRKENDAWAQQWLEKEGITKYKHIVALHPAASGPEKCWPIEYFIEVARQLAGKYQTAVIVIGSSAAAPLAQAIKGQVPQGVWNMTGQTSLGQLASLLKRCSLLISNDSGPVHVADAVGTRVIAIFTRNQPGVNPKRWRPLGAESVVLVPPPTNPQMSEEEARRIQIPPQKVLEAVDALFKLC